MRVVLVSLFFIGVLGLFIFSNFVMTGNIVNSAIMPPQGVEKIVVGEINATAWPTPLLSKEGEKFFYFAGTYLDNPSETNDYAYYTWNGGEDSNQAGRKIKSGDVLSFWSWTPNWNEEVNKIKKYPSCGIEINFVDDKNNLTSETLRWNYVDQDNIVSVKGNEKIKANWYQRNISLSDFDGREIKFISFVKSHISGKYIFAIYIDSNNMQSYLKLKHPESFFSNDSSDDSVFNIFKPAFSIVSLIC